MKKKLLPLLLTFAMFASLVPPSAAVNSAEAISHAVYLGVTGYGTVSSAEKDDFVHRFSVNGTEVAYKVAPDGDYAIQNTLTEGGVYNLTVENGTITAVQVLKPDAEGVYTISHDTDVYGVSQDTIVVGGQTVATTSETQVFEITTQAGGATVTPATLAEGQSVKVYGNPAKVIFQTFVAQPYEAPVSGTPGLRTLKNFLATAMEPVGTTLYIYGGSWDWQDVGSSNQATSIGLAQSWVDFFQSQDATFTYKNSDDHAHSYYPHNSWNQYYYAGVDCSGYVGWTMYNVMNTVSGKDGFVGSSTSMAKRFANDYHYGAWTQTINGPQDFKPGDIFSMNGHIWICLGVCGDGSIVIMHSTPSDSKSGAPGGGAQLSGMGENADCQAVKLASQYMQKYFPAWSQRYDAAFKRYDSYTSFTGANAGKFSWSLTDAGLLDPDGYATMSAEEILKDLFQEKDNDHDDGSSGSSTTTDSTKNDDGSTTVTKTSPDGTVTETTKFADGSQTVTQTQKDGTVAQTQTQSNGVTAASIVSPSGQANITLTVPAAAAEPGTPITVQTAAGSVILPETLAGQAVELSLTVAPAGASEAAIATITLDLKANGKAVADATVALRIHIANLLLAERKTPLADGSTAALPQVTMPEIVVMSGSKILTSAYVSGDELIIPGFGGGVLTMVDNSKPFSDVPASFWGKTAIDFVTARELFSGTGAATFSPNADMSRAMLVTVLWKLDGSPQTGGSKFIDIPSSSDYTQAVGWASTNGVVSGYEEGTFAPDASITRQQLAAILYQFARIQGYDMTQTASLTSFSDSSQIADWAQPAMSWAVGSGLLSGRGNGILAPNGTATRAEVAQLILSFFQLNLPAQTA